MRRLNKDSSMRADRWAQGIFQAAFGLFIAVWTVFLAVIAVGAWHFVVINGWITPLLSTHWSPLAGHYGMLAFILGSITVTALALILAAPWVLALAVAGGRILRGTMQQTFIQLLTVFVAVPSVIYGWWGLTIIVPLVRRLSGTSGFGPLSAGVVLALMIVPTFSIMALHAVRQVPSALVEGSLALGATDDQTLWHMVLPSAWPALAQAFLVAVGRALGETIAVQMVIGGQSRLTSLLKPSATLTSQLLTDLALMPPKTPGHDALDFMAIWLVLLMAVLVGLQYRMRRGLRG
ncbi:MAG: ABC transporter permease subunit [Sulfobacillus thermotolerans]|uniref:ABC transmembrane type-1 domain-containing protein n=2 Tax=Sulfobacillus TaxID=28033 RepID=A0ABM6RNT2_9FIRM|nr:hypothetical protein BXT84_02900 [Sulfobacillus thermotolerans]MCY0908475.1 ABC transporter permease subunit [Sulfobacillus thermotolerans]POB11106.1 phosphate ABC transporter permease [Sulfobacillus sp. hq2]